MAADTNISWASDTVNFWWGCDEVSPACDFCYARELDKRYKFGGETHWGSRATRWQRVEAAQKELLRNNRRAAKKGVRRRQFINSMSDFFEDREDLDDPRLMALETFRQCRNLDLLLLTKRPQRVFPILQRVFDLALSHVMLELSDMLKAWLFGGAPENIWLGTTAENQQWADIRTPHLLRTPAVIHWVSYEPALGPIDFSQWLGIEHDRDGSWRYKSDLPKEPQLDWIICGGESSQGGAEARPFDLEWARDTIRQCRAAGIAPFVKQLGANPIDMLDGYESVRLRDRSGADPSEWPEDLRFQEFPKVSHDG